MEFTSIFEGLRGNTITTAEAATKLGFTEAEMEKRIAIWGKRLKELFRVFDLIENDKITRNEAARKLGVGVREVNHLMQSWGVKRPLKEYLVTRESSAIKWELHKKWAIGFVADECSIDDAALGTGLSTRQVRRWISDLLDKHYGMVSKDLKSLTLTRRRRLADEMEKAEGLSLPSDGFWTK